MQPIATHTGNSNNFWRLISHCRKNVTFLAFTALSLSAVNLLSRPYHDEMSTAAPLRAAPSRVAVIGGAGYIGSYLSAYLQSRDFDVTVFDKDPKFDEEDLLVAAVVKVHSTDLSRSDLSKFGSVIFLGGCTGRKTCSEMTVEQVEEENIWNVVDIMKKMARGQHLIAASTSAVSEGTFGANENSLAHPNRLDVYSLSMMKREIRLREYIDQDYDHNLPRVSLLRFGTVIGNSRAQRTDLMVPSLFFSAYTSGFLNVQGHDTMRSFLSLPDLSRAVESLISKPIVLSYDIWNLASFNATVFKIASTIASLTGATINSHKPDIAPLLSYREGFSLDSAAFVNMFNFTFYGTLLSALLEFDRNVPDSITPKGPHVVVSEDNSDIMPCPVCGSKGQQMVMDLGAQPLANDFMSNVYSALARPRFPLKLVRCRVCNHYHLSHMVDRGDLFQHYLYTSGTSTTLSNYFEWLAQKVIRESMLTLGESGSILEIACNDGSQLDHFKAHGWKTFGVDPAVNLVTIAAQNHTVRNGFWPLQFPELPHGNDLTAITAQNVLAHVPDVVSFLKGCKDVMGPKTKLYVQTSQCNMQQLGQFDTVYHEHISFFTGHSFLKAAELTGLEILSFETTPIHGESCLVTMQLPKKGGFPQEKNTSYFSSTLTERLVLEKEGGIVSDFFPLKFAAHATAIRNWIKQELLQFKHEQYTVCGYGAAAKGIVLLHYILENNDDGSSYLDFVIDDASLKQNTYCPGTVIPVYPSSNITQVIRPENPVVILVFAWNFFDEISKRVVNLLKDHHREVFFIVPFPKPQVLQASATESGIKFEVIREMPFQPTRIPNLITTDENRTKAIMITHQRNEELLMPFFIMHHAPMFDEVILIDFDSDDRTLEIIERYAPPSWRLVRSSTGSVFDAQKTDEQVSFHEAAHPGDWLVALTTTEFLIKGDLRRSLSELEVKQPTVLTIPIFVVNGDNTAPLSYSQSLVRQRYMAFTDGHRFMHYNTNGIYKYSPGRHSYNGKGGDRKEMDGALIMKFAFAPWPEVRPRKMSVGETIPLTDVARRMGFQHTARLGNASYLEIEYLSSSKKSTVNLCCGQSKGAWFRRVYNEAVGKCITRITCNSTGD